MIMPDYLTHYYEKATGPFSNLSHLPIEQAEQILADIRKEGKRFASQRSSDYMQKRRALESRIRMLFEARGGRPKLEGPHYMILGSCAWLKEWYEEGQEIRMKLALFPGDCLSFTYGDSFPAMHINDGKPYRGRVYTIHEILGVIRRYGLPQSWNPDGKCGPERYIEVQVWDDAPLTEYLRLDSLVK